VTAVSNAVTVFGISVPDRRLKSSKDKNNNDEVTVTNEVEFLEPFLIMPCIHQQG
jgi:hypothetical protein